MTRFNAWLQVSAIYAVSYPALAWLGGDEISLTPIVVFSGGAMCALFHHWRWQ